MNNDIQPDLNILTAWSRGYTGLGVVLTVLDDGLEKDHPDLAANYDPLASYDFNSNDPDPQPRYSDSDKNWHGTRCAGEVAAVANNGICGAGVAYNAKIGGVRMLDGSIMDIVEAQALSLQPQYIHIYSASWGPEDDGRTVDGPGVLAAAAFHKGVVQGRGGLGSIFIWASGNGGTNYDNCNCDGYTNSIYTVSVGSVLGDGHRPLYSESCPAILTTTYSSRTTSKVQIVTTDLHHRCTDKHTGTSASAPLAAGMVALALEANPALTWRDLQHLIIRASRPAHLQAEDWAENGVGRRVSHYYGYGLLDAGLLVQEAMTWTGTRPQEKCSVQAIQVPRDISSKLVISTDASSCSKSIRSLEHVQVQLSLSYSRRGDLVVALSSPMGTTSTLVTVRPYDTSQDGYQDWTFMSTHFWDENPKGIWTLQLENRGDAENTGQLTTFILHLHGTDEDMPARRSAATATDECLRRDKQGACEGERGFVGTVTWLCSPGPHPSLSPQTVAAPCTSTTAPACPTAPRATTARAAVPAPGALPWCVPAATPPATPARAPGPTTARPVPRATPSRTSPTRARSPQRAPPARPGCAGTWWLSPSWPAAAWFWQGCSTPPTGWVSVLAKVPCAVPGSGGQCDTRDRAGMLPAFPNKPVVAFPFQG
uniref:P/Homo B domain-containing protein n=1 Tax=Zonotrichia albicollis TaxID=44394 RepID=A0A8D2MDI5_ZONAL